MRTFDQYPDGVHPGVIIVNEIMPRLPMSVVDFTKYIGISRPALYKLIQEFNPGPITPNVAMRIGQATDTDPAWWLKMQSAYDLRILREEQGEMFRKIKSIL